MLNIQIKRLEKDTFDKREDNNKDKGGNQLENNYSNRSREE